MAQRPKLAPKRPLTRFDEMSPFGEVRSSLEDDSNGG